MNFENMNVDCQLLILENLDFHSLLNMAKLNEAISILSADVYRREFSNRIIHIDEPFLEYDKPKINVYNDFILINDCNIALSVLQFFGPHILTLKISYKSDQNNQLKQIISFTNQYCSNLDNLQISSSNKYALENIQNEFPKVEDAKFGGKFINIESNTLKLNEMFPKLRRLSLKSVEISKNDSMNLHFPHLESLDIIFKEFSNQNAFKNLIIKNTQIKELSLDNINSSYTEFASNHLPNIESLNIQHIQALDHTGEIHFKNVKKINIGTIKGGPIENITFDQLEELECNPYYLTIWSNFIAQNRNITKLIFTSGISDAELLLLTDTTSNLVEASFGCDFYVEVATFVQFLEKSNQLKRLNLWLYGLPEYEIEEIKTIVMENWNCEMGLNGYIFNRKNVV